MGWTISRIDHSVFYFSDGTLECIVLVSTDDMVVAGNCITAITHFKSEISKHFEIKDLGEIHWLLG